MQKTVIPLFALLFSVTAFSQKPEYYYNAFLEPVSQEAFDSIENDCMKLNWV